MTAGDLRRLLDVVGEANGLEDLPQFRSSVCELLGRLAPYDIAGYNEVRPGETLSLLTRSVSERLLEEFTTYAYQNPLIARIERTRDGRPHRISDLMDRTTFQQLDLYRSFYRHVGIEYQVAFTLPSTPPLIIGLALCRQSADFSDREVQLLALARPHMIQAYRTLEARGATRELVSALEAGVTTAGRDLVMLDSQGRVEFASDGSRRLLGELGLMQLPGAVEFWLSTRQADAGYLEPLSFAVEGRQLLIHALPGQPGDRHTLLLVRDGDPGVKPLALAAFGLTPREAEALSRMMAGDSPAHAAADMGIARRTLDKHLQHIFAKLGATSREQAIAAARAAVGIEWPNRSDDAPRGE